MQRPTTKDLASHLGMSRSTVDRVLNGRPGVKTATVEAVNRAIEELGFERNIAAANLAKSRVYRLVFLLPKVGGDFLSELEREVEEIRKPLAVEGLSVASHRVLDRDPHKAANTIARYSAETVDGVAVLTSDSPQVRDALTRLTERGVHVVRMLSGDKKDSKTPFIGIDNYAAGRTAARLLGSFCGNTAGQVLVLTDAMTDAESAERRKGFDETLQSKFPSLTALPTLEVRQDAQRAIEIVSNAFRNYENLVGAYVMGSEARDSLEALRELGKPISLKTIAHERTPLSVRFLREGFIDALIVQNPGHVVRSAVRMLQDLVDKRQSSAAQNTIRLEILVEENLGS